MQCSLPSSGPSGWRGSAAQQDGRRRVCGHRQQAGQDCGWYRGGPAGGGIGTSYGARLGGPDDWDVSN